MALIPSAIIFINDDLVPEVQAHIERQLHISQTLDGYSFDATLVADPDFVSKVKALHRRILVIRPYTELDNRTVPDVVIFVKAAMVSVLKNNFGPPAATFAVNNLHWGQLGIY